MKIDAIKNGIVIDHITTGRAMDIYRLLHLDALDCTVALLIQVGSRKMGRKDIIKIDADIAIDLDVLGFIDPGVTVNVIRDEKTVEKKRICLPERLTGVIRCKNPRCITSCEQELPHVFTLTDRDARVYRCLYCESKADI